MNARFVFEAIRAHLRARGMGYQDVAAALNLSESAVKKMFARRDCTLRRLDELCDVIGVDLCEIARGSPRQRKLIDQLSHEQEQEIIDDIQLFIVAVCAMQGIRLEDITRLYKISEAQCVAQFARLDKIGFLELMPHNRYRLLVAKAFLWIPDGPIMRWSSSHAPDYFDHLFDGPTDILRVVNVRLSTESRSALISRLEKIAMEFEEQHNSDASLPMDRRHPLTVCLAARPWEPKPFKDMRRRERTSTQLDNARSDCESEVNGDVDGRQGERQGRARPRQEGARGPNLHRATHLAANL